MRSLIILSVVVSEHMNRKLSGKDTIKLSRELTPGGSSPPDFVPTKEYLRRPKFSFHLKACNALYVNIKFILF